MELWGSKHTLAWWGQPRVSMYCVSIGTSTKLLQKCAFLCCYYLSNAVVGFPRKHSFAPHIEFRSKYFIVCMESPHPSGVYKNQLSSLLCRVISPTVSHVSLPATFYFLSTVLSLPLIILEHPCRSSVKVGVGLGSVLNFTYPWHQIIASRCSRTFCSVKHFFHSFY